MDDTSLGRYEEKMRRTTEKLGAKFIKYDRKSGDWIFQVEHFSRYGLLDDDDVCFFYYLLFIIFYLIFCLFFIYLFLIFYFIFFIFLYFVF